MEFTLEVNAEDRIQVSLATLAEAYGPIWVWFIDDELYQKVKSVENTGQPHWMPTEFARTLTHEALTTSFPVTHRGTWHVLVDGHPQHEATVQIIKPI